MTTSTTLSPDTPIANGQDQFSLRHTNVSNPSIIHSKPSKQSITASEDYYSLSSESSASTARANDFQPINRYTTPPSRYRTPAQSQSQLNLPSQHENPQLAEVRKTPMRGEGRRRQSNASSFDNPVAGATVGGAVLREGGVRRKPVPSTVMESASGEQSPRSQEYIDPTIARSSVARDIDREGSPMTPGQDDTPFIRFALDQLTRDEEVRGSRRYPGQSTSGAGEPVPVIAGAAPYQRQRSRSGLEAMQIRERQRAESQPRDDQGGMNIAPVAGAAALGVGAAGAAYAYHRHEQQQPQPTQQWPVPSRQYDELPPRHPRHTYSATKDRDPGVYLPVDNDEGHYERLNFLPGILRPLSLISFLLLILLLLALLLTCAIWSLTHNGIFDYGYFGGSTYFVLEYLPILLGMLLLVWLLQIEVAVYRMAPFIAMSSQGSTRSWEEGARLPLYPKSWFTPCGDHFSVPGLAPIGFFLVISWLQIWTIPLLASAFNVYFFGNPSTGKWRWVATAGIIWIVVAFYIILFIATIVLLFFLRRKTTGLKWDPRSLADMVVLLERSNALSLSEDDELRHEPPRLGYWRASTNTTNDVFHTYAVADKVPRMYSVANGRLTERLPAPAAAPETDPQSRFSDFDDLGREQRHSREKMLPRQPASRSSSPSGLERPRGNAVPWFLKPASAALWIIIAIVLTLAFLIVSYLPTTKVTSGFPPLVEAPVNGWGYSSTNFLYSFLPALLALIAYLGLLDVDFAYRRLQPYASLLSSPEGEVAEHSLLLSYTADLPFLVSAGAALNGHFRIALLSLTSLLSTTLPILAGGVFWAQFDIPTQSIKIYAQPAAYIALTVFVVIYAFSIITCVWPSKSVREIDAHLPRGNEARRWVDMMGLVRNSRIVDEVSFRHPSSKIELVTRLLSSSPNTLGRSQEGAGTGSKMSLADSLRGFGRARQAAGPVPGEKNSSAVARFMLGEIEGRDGDRAVGVDRVR